jgi:DNA-binding GntR family transcriptional regulator
VTATRSNKQRLYEDLRRKILTMELEPSATLDETSLSLEYGISRTPLREIFRQLAGEGYIQILSNRGTFVSPMSHQSMRDFFATAPMVYASTGRMAARKARPAQVAQLAKTQGNFRSALERNSAEEMIFWNVRFHHLIGEIAANQYLMPSLERLLIDQARIGQTFWRPKSPEMQRRINLAAEQHDQMIEAIESGDEEATVELTMRHWDLSSDQLERFVR